MNKNNYYWLAFFAGFLLWCFLSIYSLFPGFVTTDTGYVYLLHQKGIVMDWKPALYTYIVVWLESLGIGSLYALTYVAHVLLLGLSIFAFLAYLMKTQTLKCVFVVPIICLLVSHYSVVHYVANDTLFSGTLAAAISLFLWATLLKGIKRKLLIIFALLFSIVALHMRLNSPLCFIPLYFIALRSMASQLSIKKALLFTLLLVGANTFIAKSISPLMGATKTYPLNSPFANDIINLSTMNKKWHPLILKYRNEEGAELIAKNEWPSFRAEIGNYNQYLSGLKRRDDLSYHEELKQGWIQTVKENPKDYIILKLFLFQQNLLAGRSLPWVNSWMESKYPQIKIPNKESYSNNIRNFISLQFFALAGLPLLTYLLVPALCLWAYFKKDAMFAQMLKLPLVLTLCSILYSSTFLLFTVAPLELRFHHPQSTLATLTVLALFYPFCIKIKGIGKKLRASLKKEGSHNAVS